MNNFTNRKDTLEKTKWFLKRKNRTARLNRRLSWKIYVYIFFFLFVTMNMYVRKQFVRTTGFKTISVSYSKMRIQVCVSVCV